jgi:hypothetical protein
LGGPAITVKFAALNTALAAQRCNPGYDIETFFGNRALALLGVFRRDLHRYHLACVLVSQGFGAGAKQRDSTMKVDR